MAIVFTDNKHYQDIANKMRELAPYSFPNNNGLIKPEEMVDGVQSVYWAGELSGEGYGYQWGRNDTIAMHPIKTITGNDIYVNDISELVYEAEISIEGISVDENANVMVCNSNLANINNSLSFTQSYTHTFSVSLPPGIYTLSGEFISDAVSMVVRLTDTDGEQIVWKTLNSDTSRQSYTFSTSKRIKTLYFYSSTGYIESAGIKATVKNFQINKGNMALPYEFFSGYFDGITMDIMTPLTVSAYHPYTNVFTDTPNAIIFLSYNSSLGMQNKYDEFWDNFQNYGNRTMYMGAFGGGGWNNTTFKPKYIVKPSANGAFYLFHYCNYGNPNLDFRKYKDLFDFSNVKNPTGLFENAYIDYIEVDLSNCINITNCFNESFNPGHKTHITLKVSDITTTGLSNAFSYCSKLTDLIFMDGSIIVNSINLQYCPLTKESFESVINALSTSITGKTATFKKTAKEAAFTDEEWAALIATKPNWTFSLI